MKLAWILMLSFYVTHAFAEGPIEVTGKQAVIIHNALLELSQKDSRLVQATDAGIALDRSIAGISCEFVGERESVCHIIPGSRQGLAQPIQGDEARVLYKMLSQLAKTYVGYVNWFQEHNDFATYGGFGGGGGNGSFHTESNMELRTNIGNLRCTEATQEKSGESEITNYLCDRI